ncbi:MAG: cache domain-containing protein, partial [Sulfurimonas denitrificans]|nr:cache domain-containing protein [Sulfurimonas denitrificans]
MNIPNRTKRNTLMLALFILLSSSLIAYLFLNYQLKKSINSEFERVVESTHRLFEINLKDEKEYLDISLDELLLSDGLSKAVANGDYKAIDSIVSPYYKKLKQSKKAVNILTFRSEDGITLYRAHKPEFFGDKVSQQRKLIADTNFFKRSFDGFEVGKFEMTYRVTRPIFYNEKYVGNLELGISPEYFLHELNAVFKTELGIAIDKKLLDIFSNKEEKGTVAIDDRYVLIDNKQNLKKYFMDENRSESLYKVSMNISLKNHLSESLGHLIVGFDIRDIAEKNTNFIYMLFFMIALMMFILVGILHFGFNKILKHFSKQVYKDHLTNLKNRYALDDALTSQKSKVLILSNIKEFSLLNELYGVHVGNETLIQVAHAFKEFAQEHSFEVYRISSDEYVLLKNDENFDEDSYSKLTEELHCKINSLNIVIHGVDEIISIEIYSGIAHDHAHSLEDAQMALKKAKKNSLSYMIYSKNVDTKESSQTILNIKKTIKHALEHKNVVPFFQPITDKNGTIVKYEALVRIVEFDNGKKNILSPAEFLDISMKSGSYIKIAKEMLE